MVIGCLSIVGGYLAIGQNVAALVALAFARAASANLPTILYTLFWRRFNTTGGLGSCLLLIVFSPVFSGGHGPEPDRAGDDRSDELEVPSVTGIGATTR